MSVADPTLTQPSPAPRLSAWTRIQRIFMDPAHAWDGLREKSAWAFPLLLGLLVWVGLQLATYDRIMLPTMFEAWDDAVANGKMEPAQEAQLRQFFAESPAGRWILLGQQAIVFPIIAFLQGLVLWFGIGFVLGTRMRYGSAMDVMCWSGLVKIPQLLLFFGLAFQRETFKGVHLGLGVLVPEGDAPSKIRGALQGFLDLIGPFEAWWMFVLVLGASALSGAPRKRVAWVVVALYLALGAFFAAVGAFFGPGA